MNSINIHTSRFGFEELPESEKSEKVQTVFTSVSEQYDHMNDLMSLGLHYGWKKQAVSYTRLYPGDNALDLACGTCDITYYLKKRYHKNVQLVASDPNLSMLSRGKAMLIDNGLIDNISFSQHFAEQLPYQDAVFSLVICAFGYRNFTDQETALQQIYRVLRPGGQCIILEFSKPQARIFEALYEGHAQYIIPQLGRLVSNQPEAYQYLIDSIATHPDQETVKQQLIKSGFSNICISNILSGIVAIHRGIKC